MTSSRAQHLTAAAAKPKQWWRRQVQNPTQPHFNTPDAPTAATSPSQRSFPGAVRPSSRNRRSSHSRPPLACQGSSAVHHSPAVALNRNRQLWGDGWERVWYEVGWQGGDYSQYLVAQSPTPTSSHKLIRTFLQLHFGYSSALQPRRCCPTSLLTTALQQSPHQPTGTSSTPPQ